MLQGAPVDNRMMPVPQSVCPDIHLPFARRANPKRQVHHGQRVGFTTLSRLRQIAFTEERLLSAIVRGMRVAKARLERQRGCQP